MTRNAPAAETVFEVLGDESTRRVFARLDTPLSAQDVSEESGIPLSTVYRALDRLEEADLAERKIVIRDDGNRVFRFVRATDELAVSAGGGELELDAGLEETTVDARAPHSAAGASD
jgi:DNA-binding transcriptional ArsR family regulator